MGMPVHSVGTDSSEGVLVYMMPVEPGGVWIWIAEMLILWMGYVHHKSAVQIKADQKSVLSTLLVMSCWRGEKRGAKEVEIVLMRLRCAVCDLTS
jgi:hypothetical protein